MSRLSMGEILPKKKSVNYGYVIGAVIFLVIFVVVCITNCTKGPEEEAVEAVVKPEWDTQIRINEVMADNSIFVPAANGKYYDWVELYNAGETAVDLSGHFISDNPEKLDKFLIEELIIEPDQYVLIYMSRLSGIDENGILHTSFALSSIGESIYISNEAGEIISTLTVPAGGSNISYGILNNELVWMSNPTPGEPNSGAASEQQNTLEYDIAKLRINEYMTDNRSIIYDCDGDYNDWVELYNYSNEPIDLSSFTMTDNDENIDKWKFPEGTVIGAGECLLIFCSDKDKTDSAGYIHTNFRLGAEDTAVTIYTPQLQVCAREELVFVPENSSYGYVSDSDMQAYFSLPTPGAANSTPAVSYTDAQLAKMQGIYE